MLNWLKRSLGALLAVCMLVSMLPTALAADRSEISGHWAEKALTYFVDQGWLLGDERGYRPDANITRAEFMTLLNAVCGYTQRDDAAAKAFRDVKEDQWYFKQVSVALAAGYVSGNGDGTMTPNANITREEAFSMIARIAGVSSKDTSALNKFKDQAKTSSWARASVAALVELGYVNGYPEDGTLRPLANITRAESVQSIQDPNDSSAYAGVVSATDLAIDTSGGYERYFEGDDGEIYWHILDPHTGYPAKSVLISVTVLSDSALTGDGLSTALFVMGLEDAMDYWRTNGGFEFIFITDQNEIYVSQGAQDLFQPLGNYENAEIHVVTEAA